MTRLVFVSYLGLNETRERAFRFDALSARGLPVAYWDISALYGHAPDPSTLSRPYVRRFASWPELDAALTASEMADAVVVPGFGFEPKTFGAFLRLSRSPARLASILIGLLPTPPAAARTVGDTLRLAADPRKLGHFLAKRGMLAARKLGRVRGFDLALAAGSAARDAAKGLSVVPIHHCDYDDWVAFEASDARLVPGRYAVFLDQYLPSHPDYAIEGVTDRIDPARFYGLLNGFFRRLEERHGLEVVVAAHPKADYSRNPFDGRKTFKSETRRLVRHAELSITSYSSAVGYPVLARQPVLFIDTDDIIRLHKPMGQDLYPRHFASALGGRYVRMDHPDAADVEPAPVDPARYDDYKYRYLVSRETEATPTADSLADFLRNGRMFNH